MTSKWKSLVNVLKSRQFSSKHICNCEHGRAKPVFDYYKVDIKALKLWSQGVKSGP